MTPLTVLTPFRTYIPGIDSVSPEAPLEIVLERLETCQMS